jgi:hypothetical protein
LVFGVVAILGTILCLVLPPFAPLAAAICGSLVCVGLVAANLVYKNKIKKDDKIINEHI